MTIAELALLGAALVALYVLLRPLQRWIETRLLNAFASPRRRSRRAIIDVTDFTSRSIQKKDDDDQRA